MTRVAAHKITCCGRCHTLSIATLTPDGRSVEIVPLEKEVHSTPFINGHIEVAVSEGKLIYRKLN